MRGNTVRFVGFIRHVMIGREGLHRVALLERVASLGGGRPVSFITTGNIAFDLAPAALEDFVEALEDEIAVIIVGASPSTRGPSSLCARSFFRSPLRRRPSAMKSSSAWSASPRRRSPFRTRCPSTANAGMSVCFGSMGARHSA